VTERWRRRLRVVAWLLMPVAVWAASFCGGWLGALAVEGRIDQSGPLWMGLGGALGGLIGLVMWLLLLRVLGRPKRKEDQQPASTATS
jgi:membrane associated rhomboid family serine protease